MIPIILVLFILGSLFVLGKGTPCALNLYNILIQQMITDITEIRLVLNDQFFEWKLIKNKIQTLMLD